MGKFYTTKTWLEDREIEILASYNFKEEVWETEVPEDKRWVLYDLELKGFLHSVNFEGKKYYQHSGGYLQHFDNMDKDNKNTELDNTDKKLHISDVIVSSTMWYDKFKIGDIIRYDIIVNYRKTGERKDFVLTEEILNNIKKYEDESNFHNMRVVN